MKPFNLRSSTKLSSKTDANFNAVKIKRWSDYRKSWHQQMRNSKSSPEKSLSKSEQHLSQIGKIKRLLFSNATFQPF